MVKPQSFSATKFKMHNGGLSSSEQIKRKREKHINQTVNNNSDIKKNGNKIVNINNYATYLELTKPKYTAVYDKNIMSGHNLYKIVNKTGNVNERQVCYTDCDTDNLSQNEMYLEKPINEFTNIDISYTEAEENALSIFSLS